MTILCSTPTVNHDPLPWVIEYEGVSRRFPAWLATGNSIDAAYRPRSGYDVHTAHQPNPLLVAARNSNLHIDELGYTLAAHGTFGGYKAWNDKRHPFHALTLATPEQIDHAQRVLERLLTYAAAQSNDDPTNG